MEDTSQGRPYEKSGKKIVLVVEDEPALIEFYKDVLEDDYDVRIASSGDEALNAIKILGRIDLILLDIVLPGASGVDVLKEVKRSFPSIPVMVVTATKNVKTSAESCALLGASAYLEKPFEVSELLDKIQCLVESKP